MRVWSHWDRLHNSNYKLHSRTEHQFISIIIIARNEEQNISDCLSSIQQNTYPENKFEIILVDDHSTDETVRRASRLNIKQLKILHLADFDDLKDKSSYKKAGIQYALKKARGEIIVCTDADCIIPRNWLAYVDFGMQQALIKMLVMPIYFMPQKSILNRFQSVDMMATMAFTGYGIQSKQFYSANGANIAVRKSIYSEVNLHTEFASGDDMFLVQEVSRLYPDGVKFIKSKQVLVKTKAESNWTALLKQRKRWATKSKAYSTNALYKIQTSIFIFNFIIVTNLLLGFAFNSLFLFICLFQLLIKGIMDFLLLKNMSEFFNQREALKLYILSFLLFTPYIILMGGFALFGKSYHWKGRQVN